MGRFVFLQNTAEVPGAMMQPPNGHIIDVVDQYVVHANHLQDADGLLLSQHLDEHHLGSIRPILQAYLAGGGAISVNGPVAKPFLDGLGAYVPLKAGPATNWLLRMADPHPITDGILADDLAYRRGVLGFWARGGFPVPDSASALTVLVGGDVPADMVWHPPDGGRVVLHPGNDVWFVHKETNSAASFFPNMLNWMTEART